MKKRIFQVLALVLALVMCAAVAVSVLAEEDDNSGTGTSGTPSNGGHTPNKSGKVYFDKNLIMPSDATVPEVKFNFTLSANTTGENTIVGGFTVYPGIFDLKTEEQSEEAVDETENENAVPATDPVDGEGAYSVSYDGLHPTTKGQAGNSITSDENQKYATESFGIDFSKVDYTEPGMYRYKITEDEGTAPGVEYTGTATTYYIDVYVKRSGDDIVIADVIVSKDDKLDEDEDEDEPSTSDPTETTEPSESNSESTSGDDESTGSTSGDDESTGGTSGDDTSSDTSGDTSSGSDKVNTGNGEGGDDTDEPGEGDPNEDDRIPNEGGEDDNSSSEGGESGGEGGEGGESGGEGSEGGESSGDTSDPGTTPSDPTKPNPNVNRGVSKADFNNVYEPLTLEITKTVNGDQGVRKDYFKFEVSLSGVKEGVYKIVGAQNDSGSDAYLVVYKDSNDEGKATVYLKHNTGVTILVPYNTGYEIVEDEEVANANEYKTSTAGDAGTWGEEDWKAITDEQAAEGKTAIGTVADAPVTVAFVNYKDGTISTGILLAIAPFVILMVVAVVGGVIVLKKKKED